MSTFKYMEMWEIEFEAMTKMCVVIVAQAHELQFDHDDQASEDRFWQWIQLARQTYSDLEIVEWRSRSGNTHRVVAPIKVPIEEKIAMQSMGGSDPGREWAALQCHKRGSPHPILLYKPLPKLLTSGVDNTCSN
jgi:hypothetical protein